MRKVDFISLADAHGIAVEYTAGGIARATAYKGKEPYAAEILLDAPRGKIFMSSGCHSDNSLCHDLEVDGTKTNWPGAYKGLQAIIALGLEDCPDRPSCDICDEPEEGWPGADQDKQD